MELSWPYVNAEEKFLDVKERDSVLIDLIKTNDDDILQKNGFTVIQQETVTGIPNEYPRLASSNSPSDVELTAPKIVKDEITGEYVITCVGKWKNANWQTQDLGAQWASVGGKSLSVGGLNCYGFVFSEAYGDYTNLGVRRVSANIVFESITYYKNTGKNKYEPAGTHQVSSTSPSAASSKGGIIMEVQDSMVIQHIDAMWYDYTYDNKEFVLTARYSAEFKNFHGNVSTFMCHTYKRTMLGSASFGIKANASGNIEASLNLTFEKAGYSWTAYSGEQTRF